MNSFCTQHFESAPMAAARFSFTPCRLHRDESQAMAVAQFSITPFHLQRSESQAMAATRFGITPYHLLVPERKSRCHITGICFDSTPSQSKEFVQEETGDFGLKINGSKEFVEEATSDFGIKINGSKEFVEAATRHMGLQPNPDNKTFTCSGKVYDYSDISFLKERNRKFLEKLSHLSDMFEEGSSPLTALQVIISGGEPIVILEDSEDDAIFEADKDFHVPKDFGNNEELQSALDEFPKS